MVRTDPIPQSNEGRTPYSKRLEQMTHAELLVELKENSLRLLTRHELERDPTREYSTFRFRAENHALYEPESVTNSVGKIYTDEVTFRTELDSTQGIAVLSVTITGYTSTGKSVVVTLSVNGESVQTSYQIEDDESELPPIDPCTAADVNRLIASAILPNKTGDYSFFDTLDLGEPQIIHNIGEALERHSDSTEHTGVYGGNGQHVAYEKIDGHVMEIALETHLKNGTPITINTLHGDAVVGIAALDSYPLDGIEIYEQSGKELPQLGDTEVREQCMALRERSGQTGFHGSEISFSPEQLDEYINTTSSDPNDRWHA